MSEGGITKESYGKKSERLVKRLVRNLLAALSSGRGKSTGLPLEPGSVKSAIVIRQHNQFGDVLCTVPLLRALKARFDLDELAVVVSPQNISALAGCRYATELINYDKLSFYRHPAGFLKFVRKLRRGYDLLLVPSNVSLSLTNDILALVVKAGTKIGPGSLESRDNKTASVYDVAVNLRWEDLPVHQYLRNMRVAEPLGITGIGDGGGLEYEVDPVKSSEAQKIVGRAGETGNIRVAIHAGAGKTPNRWNIAGFAALSELLYRDLKADIYITEGPMDHEVIDQLTVLLKAPFVRVRNRAISFVAALLKQMDLVITNDTGVMHLAAAVGTPTLSLFGPTDPLQWAPPGEKNRFILGKGGDINSITVDKVFGLARKVLQIK